MFKEKYRFHLITEVKYLWAGWVTILVALCCMPLEFRLALYSTLAPPTCAIVWRLSFSRSQRAYSSIEEELNISVSHIRNKIVGVRSQLARELAKTNSKKSGKGRHECYKSTWIYWERLQFLKRCMFGIVWPPPNFQQAALSNMQPTCWIVQHLSFGRAFKEFFSGYSGFPPSPKPKPGQNHLVWVLCSGIMHDRLAAA